jgi:predicted phage-related endonuclease
MFMSKATLGTVVIAGTILAPLLAGCVSRDEYLRQKFAEQNSATRAAGMENELADERARTKELRNQVEALQREKETLNALADNLKAETRPAEVN